MCALGWRTACYLSRGVLAESNAQMVEKARDIVEKLGGQIATPRDAREMLGLSSQASGTRKAA